MSDAPRGRGPSATNLAGQVAVVTGASRGIGRAIAIRLGLLGADAVVNYARDAAGAADTVAAITEGGAVGFAVQADVSDPAQVVSLFDATRTRFGGVDIVVANAGIDETGAPSLRSLRRLLTGFSVSTRRGRSSPFNRQHVPSTRAEPSST